MLAFPNLSRRGRRAFTLLEILVVLAILGLLATLLITNVGSIFGESRTRIAEIFVTQTLKTPLNAYRFAIGDFPTTAEGLPALLAPPEGRTDRWRGPYLDAPGNKLPQDPWGESYQYRYPGVKNKNSFDLWSKGPDKTDGTDDDIGNW
ncbi:MAG: type II secretion system major pseudopilin GspG [Opitutaceae bacterium]|nr:type II secretion system major pseudopilin GspG [Opitutaceae bacterium]